MKSSGDVAGLGPYVTSGSGTITQLTSLVERGSCTWLVHHFLVLDRS
jgi:hypothetical protein